MPLYSVMKSNRFLYVIFFIGILCYNSLNAHAQSISTGAVPNNSFCAGAIFNLSYTSTGVFNSPNTFTAQLSDSLGNFSTSTNIGQVVSTGNNGSITVTIPNNVSPSFVARIRVVASNPSTIGTDNGTNIIIGSLPTVDAGLNQTICAGNGAVMSGTVGPVAPFANWTTRGSGMFNNTSLLQAVYTPSVADINAGSVVLILTTNDPVGPCNAVSDSMVLTINSIPTVNAGVDQRICRNNTVLNMAGSMGGSSTSASWISLGSGTFNNNTLLNATYTLSNADKLANSIRFVLTSNDPPGPCVSVRDTVEVFFDSIPTINAGIDQTICAGSTATMAGTVSYIAPYANWSSSGSGFFNNNSNLSAVYTPSLADILAGSVTLTFTTNDPAGPCSAVSDAMVLTINRLAVLNAGADQTVCANIGSIAANGIIGGAASAASWKTLGTGSFNDSNLLNAIYIPSSADRQANAIRLVLTTNDPIGPCPLARDTMTVFFNPVPQVNAGSDQTICANNVANLSGWVNSVAPYANWYAENGGIFNNTSNLNATYTPSPTDISTGKATLILLTNNPEGPCEAKSDTVVISLNNPHSVNAGTDKTICSNANAVSLKGLMENGTTNTLWNSDGSGYFDDSTQLNTIYKPSAQDLLNKKVNLILNSTNFIQACAYATDTVTVYFKDSLVSFSREIKYVTCDSALVSFTNKTISLDNDYTWNFGGNDSSNTVNAEHVFKNIGSYFEVSLTARGPGGCVEKLSKSVNISNVKPKAVFSVNDSAQCQFDNVFELGNSSSGGAFTWITELLWDFGDGTTSNATFPSGKRYDSAGIYTIKLLVSASSGCKDSISRQVEVIPGPTKPRIFVNSSKLLESDVSGVAYQWYYSGNLIAGATAKTYYADTNYGLYAVKVDSLNACANMSDNFAYQYTSIKELNKLVNAIGIYPNPAVNEIRVMANEKLDFGLFDCSGKNVLTGSVDGKINTIDISQLPVGLYLLKLYNQQTQFVQKVIKE